MGAASGSAQPKQMRIRFAEPVELKATAEHFEFDVYGRRFSSFLALLSANRARQPLRVMSRH